MANVIGLLVLAGLTALLATFVPDSAIRMPLWVFIYAAMAACGLFFWSHHLAPQSSTGWLILSVASIPVAALFFALDGIIGLFDDSSLSFFEAITSNGWFVLNFGISPCFTFIAMSGWVRSLWMARTSAPNPTVERDAQRSARPSP